MIQLTVRSSRRRRSIPRTTRIDLDHQWQLGTRLAVGGFGEIFEAVGNDGTVSVVKLIPKAPGAGRELLFEELSGVPNVIPVLDSGEWKGYYVLVMPRAEKSLRRHLEEADGGLTVEDAVDVLIDIAQALSSLERGVVHRDLKPENILLYQGHWCLADFGIARYAEATTAPDTHKFAMTPAYAAPEQWRGERVTSAADVYAFGVMAFELLQGLRPFPGPHFRQQHLEQTPNPLRDCPAWLASLVSECLFKAPASRPTAGNVLARLQANRQASLSPAALKLQAVQKAVVERQAEETARLSAARTREEGRRELFKAAGLSLAGVLDTLEQRVFEAAHATEVSKGRDSLNLLLGGGALIVASVQMAPPDCLAAFDYESPFDVIAYTAITVRKPSHRWGYEGRSHSLWFCDAQDEGVYRWYELAFMVMPGIPESYAIEPFSLSPTDEYAGRALAPVMDIRQVAWEPVPVDQGDEGKFVERWLEWFAMAADGSLSHPSTMPENSGGARRRPRRRQT